MVTYQDLLEVGEYEDKKKEFVRGTINKYINGDDYKTALAADQYDKKRNPDIAAFTKYLYTASGQPVIDTYSSTNRLGRMFFPTFVTQEAQYLLSNGVTWSEKSTADKLGTAKAPFDKKLSDLAHMALVHGVAYGFWNLDHVETFGALNFVPLYDEENGALRAGIRFWQIDQTKPLRATLYEEDGYTDYIWNRRKGDGAQSSNGEVLHEKRSYIIKTTITPADGEAIFEGQNYPTFPIVPLWGNPAHQSELVGLREQIFAYDMIKSGFCDTVQDASCVFWAIHNAPGMDDVALGDFLRRVRQNRVAITEDAGSTAEPVRLETPYESRESLLTRLEKDLYKDAMAFDPESVASGAATATEIKAAYTNLDMKCNDFEYCILEFVAAIMELAGVDDSPTFTRARTVNTSEEVQMVLSAATALDEEYVTRKILTLLGDGDQAEEIIQRRIDNEISLAAQIPVIPLEEEQGEEEQGEE